MISAIAWVPAGVADPEPKRYELSAAEHEMLRIMEEEEEQKESNAADTTVVAPTKERRKRGTMKIQMPPSSSVSGLPADLRMDEYSSDENEGTAVGRLLMDQPDLVSADIDNANEGQDFILNRHNKARSAETFGDVDDDDDDDNLEDVPDTREYTPTDVDGLDAMGLYNVGLGAGADEEDMDFDDEDESEADDVKLAEDDAIILVTKTEDDFSSLEVHVYDQNRGTLYVHHDIPLPSFPLCVAHGQVSSEGTAGNFCAVGTFDTGIEIWNLDVLNALEPSCVLGGDDTSATDMVMKRKLGGVGSAVRNAELLPSSLRPCSHTDAVMSVSWNSIHKQVIASGSADKTVKLWDVTQAGYDSAGKPNAASFDHHRGKVQSVLWHPKEGTLLATGSYDKSVALVDARSSNAEHVKSVKLLSDCECMAWDPFHPEQLTVGTEDGTISCWDVRKFQTSTPLWTKVANEFGGLSDLTYSPHVPGLMATCSVDRTVTLWDSYKDGAPAENMAPRPCGSKDMCAGKLYSVAFYESTPLLLACGGSGNILSLWNLESEEAVIRNFANRLESAAIVDSSPEPNKEDLDAMMAERAAKLDPEKEKKVKKKGKSKKGKRKAHKKGY